MTPTRYHSIDGETQSRKETSLYVGRNKESSAFVSSTRRGHEKLGARASIASQGFEKCTQDWIWKEEKKDAKGVVCTDSSAHNVTTTKLSRLRNQQKAHPQRIVHQSISSNTKKGRYHWKKCPGIAV